MLDVTSGLLLGSASGTRNLKATFSPDWVSFGSSLGCSEDCSNRLDLWSCGRGSRRLRPTRLETRTEESGMCASGSNGNYVRSMKVKCTSIVQYTPTKYRLGLTRVELD